MKFHKCIDKDQLAFHQDAIINVENEAFKYFFITTTYINLQQNS